MNSHQEAAIADYVEKGEGLPADLAFVCWREVRELRSLLESCRKERGELQQKVWRKKA